MSATPVAHMPAGAEVLPTSFGQQRLWFLHQQMPSSPSYNVSSAVRFCGELDLPALDRAITEIVRRHEILRTTFFQMQGVPHQLVHRPQPLSAELVDLTELPEPEMQAAEIIQERARKPFDLGTGPLLRVTMVRVGSLEHIGLVGMHHIICDAGSAEIFVTELNALYVPSSEGRLGELKPLAVQYGDFAMWQRSCLAGGRLDTQREYWRRVLGDLPRLPEFPLDHQRPAERTYAGTAHHFQLRQELGNEIIALGREERATVSMTLLAVFLLFLSRYLSTSDVAVASPVTARTREELEPLIGFFANTLILRADTSGDPTFREFLRQVRGVAIRAYSHQDVPFEQVIEDLSPARERGRNPLVDICFTMRNLSRVPLRLPGLTAQRLSDPNPATRFDLTLSMEQRSGGIYGAFEYSTDLFLSKTVARLADHFIRLLDGLISEPDIRTSEVSMLGAEEYDLIVRQWNSPASR